MDAAWLDVLEKMPLFKGIDKEELNGLMGCMNPLQMEYKAHTLVAAEGDDFTGIGIVLKGSTAVSRENAAGERVILSLLGPGEMFGEMAAFSGQRVWPATVTAQENTIVLFLPPGMIVSGCSKMCEHHRRMTQNMLGILTRKALQLNQKVGYLSIRSLRGRLCTYLLEQRKAAGSDIFVLPMKRHELADFLNVSRPSLSREMGRMKEEGLIDYYRSSVRILDVVALQAELQ